MNKNIPVLHVYAPRREFVLPYIAREIPDMDVVAADSRGDCQVAVIEPGDDSAGFAPDAVVLRCPNIVGTGMKGLPMELARRIARGSFYHLPGNEARLSTIHATDVAKAVRVSLGSPGVYTVTDGADPTFHDYAEALAWRINHKRILSLNSRWVRWIISPELKRLITVDQVVDGSEFASRFDFQPIPVTEYLRTHVYDDESL